MTEQKGIADRVFAALQRPEADAESALKAEIAHIYSSLDRTKSLSNPTLFHPSGSHSIRPDHIAGQLVRLSRSSGTRFSAESFARMLYIHECEYIHIRATSGITVDTMVEVDANIALFPLAGLVMPQNVVEMVQRRIQAEGVTCLLGAKYTAEILIDEMDDSISSKLSGVDGAFLNNFARALPLCGRTHAVEAFGFGFSRDPVIHEFAGPGGTGGVIHERRPAMIRQVRYNPEVAEVARVMTNSLSDAQLERVRISLSRLSASAVWMNLSDTAIDFCIALEALAGQGREEFKKIKNRLAAKVSDAADRKRYADHLFALREARNAALHEGRQAPMELEEQAYEGIQSSYPILRQWIIDMADSPVT